MRICLAPARVLKPRLWVGVFGLSAALLSAQQPGGGQPPAVSGPPGSVPAILPPPADTIGSLPMLTPSVVEQVQAQIAEGKIGAPEGFDLGIYATPPVVYSSVAVAAAPDGTTYVGLDGNLSISQFSKLGRIVRLRDLNGDGVADEAKAFVPDIDSVRGLVWNHDHLIVMHTPYISAFYDRDGDGVAEERKTLITGVGRPVVEIRDDHGQNGLEAGIDGWIYLALGDQGIKDAVGSDGRRLQVHGGGIVRFRPDGSGLEAWATGTRNNYGLAVGPLLDMFARDNTNDGGGWNVRMHYFSGFTDHGYPQRFINFQQEIIQPLADYPGGSGTGGMWLDEPAIPAEWNNIPVTVDWGQGAAYRHQVTPNGATFKISNDPFLKAPYAADVDVDAHGVMYFVTTRNAGFRWVNPERHGLMLRVAPKGLQRSPLPDFERASPAELVRLHESPSSRLRLEAQRAILRRGSASAAEAGPQLEAIIRDSSKDLRHRVAALFTYKQLLGSRANPTIGRLLADSTISAWALRALGDDLAQGAGAPIELVVGTLGSADPRVRKEALITLARLGAVQHAGRIAPLMADGDPVVAHTAMQALKIMQASDVVLAVLGAEDVSPAMRGGALAVAGTFHETRTVDGLLSLIERETSPQRRAELVGAVARLSARETEWDGEWWSTRPDTSGPYFKPTAWAETEKITAVLNRVLDRADAEETIALGVQFQRMGFSVGAAVAKFLAYADQEPALVPQIVNHFATADVVPAEAVPVLVKVAQTEEIPAAQRSRAVAALVKTDRVEAWDAALATLHSLQMAGAPPPPPAPGAPANPPGGNQAAQRRNAARALADQTRTRVLESPYLDGMAPRLIERAAALDDPEAVSADALLLKLAARRIGDSDVSGAAAQALDAGWTGDPKRRVQIIKAAALIRDTSRALQIADASTESDATVAEAAKAAVQQIGIKADEIRAEAALPRVGSMEMDALLETIAATKGDIARGRQIAVNVGCAACHTFTASESPKGPYLGAIGGIMRRRELAEAILDPGRTISQGFATNSFTLKNGDSLVGFVVREAGDTLTIRDIAAKERRIALSDIAEREHLDISLMPAGLVSDLSLPEFASLLDYLESLSATH